MGAAEEGQSQQESLKPVSAAEGTEQTKREKQRGQEWLSLVLLDDI